LERLAVTAGAEEIARIGRCDKDGIPLVRVVPAVRGQILRHEDQAPT